MYHIFDILPPAIAYIAAPGQALNHMIDPNALIWHRAKYFKLFPLMMLCL